jgi:hypothetical protein
MKKLKLHKETLRHLRDAQVSSIAGGASTAASGCVSCAPSTCMTQCCAFSLVAHGCPPQITRFPCQPPTITYPPFTSAC